MNESAFGDPHAEPSGEHPHAITSGDESASAAGADVSSGPALVPASVHSSGSGSPAAASVAEEPRFGALDIVEAFTALRHEYRGQAKESRQLVEQMQSAVQKLEELSKRVTAQPAAAARDDLSDKRLVRMIVDADHQLTRVMHAVEQAEVNRNASEQAEQAALRQRYQALNGLARWFARPLYDYCSQHMGRTASDSSLLEGLALVVSRLRQSMQEVGIQRVDVLGQPFDGTTMNAIGTLETTEVPTGHVADQISPCYVWKAGVLRFADVRVAQKPK